MNNRVYRDEDDWLAARLSAAFIEPADNGFSDLVVRRVSRRARVRRGILLAAGGLGLALALGPLVALIGEFSSGLPAVIGAMGIDIDAEAVRQWVTGNATMLLSGLLALAIPLAVSVFED